MLLSAVLVIAASSCTDSKEKTKHNQTDLQFVQQTIAANRLSMDIAELALPRVNGPDVKALAEEIKTRQEEVTASMEKLAHEWGAHVDKEHPSMAEHERLELERAEGTELDRVFLRTLREHHERSVRLTKAVIRNGESKELEKLAHEMLRAEERELEHIEEVLVGA